MTPPHLPPAQLLDSTCNLLRQFDPAGNALARFERQSGRRWGNVQLWPGAELRFWIEPRKVRGDIIWVYLNGPLPEGLEPDRGPQMIDCGGNVAELALALLGRIVSALLHKVMNEADVLESGTEKAANEVFATFHRARTIRRTLDQNVATHDYEMRLGAAFISVTAAMAANQRLVEMTTGIESGDFA